MNGLIERRARVYQRKIQSVLNNQVVTIANQLQKVGAEVTIANLDLIVQDAPIEKVIGDLYLELSVDFRRITARQMLGDLKKYRKRYKAYIDEIDFTRLIQQDPELFEIYRSVLDFMAKNGSLKVKSINEMTREEAKKAINKAIAEAQMRGLGEQEAAKLLNKAVPEQLRKVNIWRAQRIARTESHAAANWSSLQEAKPLANDLVKVWGSFIDADTRQSHIDADGQEREIDQPFDVGGFALMTPSDPTAPTSAVGEVVNCRCTILYERKNNS